MATGGTGAAGGTGEKITQTISVIPGQTITVTVGQGGAGGEKTRLDGMSAGWGNWSPGGDGGESSFGSITARGGGGAPQSYHNDNSNTETATGYTGGAEGGGAITVGSWSATASGNAGANGYVKINYDRAFTYDLYKVVKK